MEWAMHFFDWPSNMQILKSELFESKATADLSHLNNLNMSGSLTFTDLTLLTGTSFLGTDFMKKYRNYMMLLNDWFGSAIAFLASSTELSSNPRENVWKLFFEDLQRSCIAQILNLLHRSICPCGAYWCLWYHLRATLLQSCPTRVYFEAGSPDTEPFYCCLMLVVKIAFNDIGIQSLSWKCICCRPEIQIISICMKITGYCQLSRHDCKFASVLRQ